MGAFAKNVTKLFSGLWDAKQEANSRVPSNPPDPIDMQLEIWQVLEDGVWCSSKAINQGLEFTKRTHLLKNASASIDPDAITFLHLYAHEVLQSSQTRAIRFQNITERYKESLSRIVGGKNETGLWTDIKEDIGQLTDKLQKYSQQNFQALAEKKDSELETVIKVKEQSEENLSVMDSKSNVYVLAHPSGIKSLSTHIEDPRFILDLLTILILGSLSGMALRLLSLPSFFGYILVGVVLGPSGFNLIRSVIQISSLGQIGGLLLLLSLGLEFSFHKLQQIYHVAVLGTATFTMALSLVCAGVGSLLLGTSFKESFFIGLMASFSSTAVSAKCIENSNGHTEFINRSGVSAIINGILVMQDIIFCGVVSVLPVMVNLRQNASLITSLLAFCLFAAKTLCVITFALMLCRFVAPWLFKMEGLKQESERHLIILLLAFGTALLCLWLGLSGEFGAFLVGFAFSLFCQDGEKAKQSSDSMNDEKEVHHGLIGYLTGIFSVLFFASIGLFMDFGFIMGELPLLVTMVVLFIGIKAGLMYFGLHFLADYQTVSSAMIALNLAQISELVMVLGSKAIHLEIISLEAYFLIITTTSLCLIAVPLLWKLLLASVKTSQAPVDQV